MIPVKICCECGQHYAFEVEPIHGRMPYPVACPACGVDGTAAANQILAQGAPVAAPPAATGSGPIRVALPSAQASGPRASSSSAGRHRTTALPGEMDHSQARHEARAKILWGDEPQDVIRFLMIQGFPAQEATEIVDELSRERALTIRANGIKKIVAGCALICVPIGAWIGFNAIGVISLKLFAIAIIVGLYGAWLAFKGTFMLLSPESEAGDVSAQ